MSSRVQNLCFIKFRFGAGLQPPLCMCQCDNCDRWLQKYRIRLNLLCVCVRTRTTGYVRYYIYIRLVSGILCFIFLLFYSLLNFLVIFTSLSRPLFITVAICRHNTDNAHIDKHSGTVTVSLVRR